jgi:hypothetical protein
MHNDVRWRLWDGSCVTSVWRGGEGISQDGSESAVCVSGYEKPLPEDTDENRRLRVRMLRSRAL